MAANNLRVISQGSNYKRVAVYRKRKLMYREKSSEFSQIHTVQYAHVGTVNMFLTGFFIVNFFSKYITHSGVGYVS